MSFTSLRWLRGGRGLVTVKRGSPAEWQGLPCGGRQPDQQECDMQRSSCYRIYRALYKDHLPLPDILESRLGGFMFPLKMGSHHGVFNLESQVHVTLDLLPHSQKCMMTWFGIHGKDSKHEAAQRPPWASEDLGAQQESGWSVNRGQLCNVVMLWVSGLFLGLCYSTSFLGLTSLGCSVPFLSPWVLSILSGLLLPSLIDF